MIWNCIISILGYLWTFPSKNSKLCHSLFEKNSLFENFPGPGKWHHQIHNFPKLSKTDTKPVRKLQHWAKKILFKKSVSVITITYSCSTTERYQNEITLLPTYFFPVSFCFHSKRKIALRSTVNISWRPYLWICRCERIIETLFVCWKWASLGLFTSPPFIQILRIFSFRLFQAPPPQLLLPPFYSGLRSICVQFFWVRYVGSKINFSAATGYYLCLLISILKYCCFSFCKQSWKF